MAYTLKIDTFTFNITPNLQNVDVEAIQDDEENIVALRKTWRLAGVIAEDNLADLETEWGNIVSQIEAGPVDIQLLDSGTPIDEFTMLKSDHEDGPLVTSLRKEATDGDLIDSLRFSMRCIGIKPADPGTTTIEHTYSIEYRHDADNKETQTKRGRVWVQSSGSALTTARAAITTHSMSGATRRVNGSDGTVETNSKDTRATYRSVIEELYRALPSGTSDFNEIQVERVSNGRREIRVRASALGSGAEDAVRAKRPTDGTITSESFTSRPDRGREEAEWIAVEPASDDNSGGYVRWDERVSIRGGARREQWYTPANADIDPQRVRGGRMNVEVRESGTIRKLDADIKLPEPLFPDQISGQPIASKPRIVSRDKDGNAAEWERTYSRRYTLPNRQEAIDEITRIMDRDTFQPLSVDWIEVP